MTDDQILARAAAIMRQRWRKGRTLTSPTAAFDFLTTQLGPYPNESFAVLFLSARHKILAFEVLFHGSVDGASVHPRVIVQRALAHNAAAVILAHNHPSGVSEPSRADVAITRRIQDALQLIDVRVLDHVIVADPCYSLAENGKL